MSGHNKIFGSVKTGISGLGIFGLYHEVCSCADALSPVFKNAESFAGIKRNILEMNTLEIGGVFLYSTLEIAAITGFIGGTFILGRHYFYKIHTHAQNFSEVFKNLKKSGANPKKERIEPKM